MQGLYAGYLGGVLQRTIAGTFGLELLATETGQDALMLLGFPALLGTTGVDLVGAEDPSDARTILELENPLYVPQSVPLTADFVTSSTTPGDTGLQFTPLAGGIYYIQVDGQFSSAAATTGCAIAWDIGNAQLCGGISAVRSTTAGTTVPNIGNVPTGSGAFVTIGLSAASAVATDRTPFRASLIVKAAAANPTPIKFQAASEVGGSAVTVRAYETAFQIVRRS